MRVLLVRTVAALCFAGVGAVHAQIEVGTFHNPGGSLDNFGNAIAQSGDVVLIAAPVATNPVADDGGAVYIYDVNSPSEVVTTLYPSDSDFRDLFGNAIAIEGEIVLVGAPGKSDVNGQELCFVGAAYIIDITTGQQKRLIPDDPHAEDVFGSSVAICGNIAYVGAPFSDIAANPVSNEGSVYVFDITTCEQLEKFMAPMPGAGDRFGSSLAKRGDVLIVGSPGHDDSTGEAHVFDATTLQHTGTLTGVNGQPLDSFGDAVAIGTFGTLIGAFNAPDDIGGTGAGAAYIHDPDSEEQIDEIAPSLEGDGFGTSVAVDAAATRASAAIAVIGAPGDDDEASGAGAAYVINAVTGNIITKLTASDAQLFDLFGSFVSISGSHIVVGAPNEDTNGNNSGAAYLYRLELPCNDADLAEPFGVLDFDDVLTFLVAFGGMQPAADLAEPAGVFDFDDVLVFLVAFGGGCM